MRFPKFFVLAAVLVLILCLTAWADVPRLINFQGRLTDGSGTPVKDSTYSVLFTIYDALVGGTNLWSETDTVATKGGTFSVNLGSATALPDTIFDDTTRYLAMKVGADPEMSPRQRIVSMAYGYRVRTVDGATGGTIFGNTSIQSDLYVDGKVGIGTTSPAYDLDIVNTANPSTLRLKAPSHNSFMIIDKGDDLDYGYAGFYTAGLEKWALGQYGNNDFRLFYVPASKTVWYANSDGKVGIGTATPNEQLEITGNLRLPASTASVGVIKSGADRFMHNFGSDNFFAGVNAGNLTLSGSGSNTGVGRNALQALTSGNSNTAVGQNALASDSTGFANTAVGQGALYGNSTGSNNTAVGQAVLSGNTTGGYNTAVGRNALWVNTTGTYNTTIGYEANVSAGGLTNATAIGANAVVGASNALVLGGTGANAVKVGIGTTTPQGALDVVSTTGALIVPRMTTVQRDALTAVNGMIIYNTTTNQFNFREGGVWVTK